MLRTVKLAMKPEHVTVDGAIHMVEVLVWHV